MAAHYDLDQKEPYFNNEESRKETEHQGVLCFGVFLSI